MPGTRNIVGDFRLEVSAGKRKCHVNRTHVITKGETHFAYEKVPGQRLNICMKCAPPIVKKAQAHLASLPKKIP